MARKAPIGRSACGPWRSLFINTTGQPNKMIDPTSHATPEILFEANADGTYAVNSLTIGTDIANATISFINHGEDVMYVAGVPFGTTMQPMIGVGWVMVRCPGEYDELMRRAGGV